MVNELDPNNQTLFRWCVDSPLTSLERWTLCDLPITAGDAGRTRALRIEPLVVIATARQQLPMA